MDFLVSARALAVRTVKLLAQQHCLTRRETEVFAWASEGKCTKEIATRMGVTGKTVEYFWARIYAKLGCSSQIEVMAVLLRRACESRLGR